MVVLADVLRELSWTDRLLTPAILLSMIVGVIIGELAGNDVRDAFDTTTFRGVSLPIAIGLIVMMWPVLTKVQYEALPALFSTWHLWTQTFISLFLNWIIGPFVMLGLAWATLPDLPLYRTGVIMVGLARCIAMVMIWNQLARGDANYCAVLVIINSVLQIILYSPLAVLFINIIGHADKHAAIRISYGEVAIAVLIYLGIPLAAGCVTRYSVWLMTSKHFLEKKFLPYFGHLSLIGLLYTIIVMFAYQGHQILHHLGPVFRTMVPLVLYFVIMWNIAFWWLYRLNGRYGSNGSFSYEMAVVQAFTSGSNNFELAIAVAIAVYGVDSQQALAATIGPLVEVPVLLALTWVALYLRAKLSWTVVENASSVEDVKVEHEGSGASPSLHSARQREEHGVVRPLHP
ncbi:arsenical-resistance protein ACR3 [Punctularia strigosozonata HHB-11173 SS5]|uniref:arsenical-resistance protein ACR3 n=1 Tax=Punctularia strigosozonata (strain HHB-11173) TaxID=741275 RepID=UPI000441759F|nr:arsenical-resistance protein ACR3 [Punctularia strigosozonata HHB-11173 SS5]EIN07861.1 arsenical-resistance protein ACR3 [Punctularia strigosozonata HHB-11173 SS5]